MEQLASEVKHSANKFYGFLQSNSSINKIK